MHVFKESIHLDAVARDADLYILLPKNHDDGDKSFPVVYMHDGQNLFSQYVEDSYASRTWQIEHAISQPDMPEVIVVGISSPKSERRLDEYSPWVFEIDYPRGGAGEKYMRAIKETIKPMIDARFNTDASKDATALIGSSMGGIISLYGLLAHGDTFTRAASLSGAFFTAPNAAEKWLKAVSFDHVKKLYMDTGEQENSKGSPEDYLTTNGHLAALISDYLDPFRFRYEVIKDGTHTAEDWASRIGGVIRYLFSDK